jgi:hypothetical protein
MRIIETPYQHGLTPAEYLRMRERYLPEHPKIIFVLESPPKSGKYFYNPEGLISEPLFSAMMKGVLEIKPTTKDEGPSRIRHGRLSAARRDVYAP